MNHLFAATSDVLEQYTMFSMAKRLNEKVTMLSQKNINKNTTQGISKLSEENLKKYSSFDFGKDRSIREAINIAERSIYMDQHIFSYRRTRGRKKRACL